MRAAQHEGCACFGAGVYLERCGSSLSCSGVVRTSMIAPYSSKIATNGLFICSSKSNGGKASRNRHKRWPYSKIQLEDTTYTIGSNTSNLAKAWETEHVRRHEKSAHARRVQQATHNTTSKELRKNVEKCVNNNEQRLTQAFQHDGIATASCRAFPSLIAVDVAES